MSRICDDHGINCAQHLGCCQFTGGEANQQRLNNSGVQKQATDGGFKRSHLKKFQSKATSSHQLFLLSSREVLVRECARLAIRRAAAGCVAPSAGADEDDGLPYMKLDKVTRHAVVSRETFGPLYLVT